jgi:OOP family OmpA-OmpF porin
MQRRVAWVSLAATLVACGSPPEAREPRNVERDTARDGWTSTSASAAPSASAVAPATSSAPPASASSVAPVVGSSSAAPDSSPSATVPTTAPPPVVEPPALVVDRAQRLFLGGSIAFRDGEAALELSSDAWLGRVVEHLRDTPRVTRLRIEAHTELAGAEATNLTLSKARALAVARWLVLHGVDCRRLVPVGFGASRPRVAPETTPAEREQNRRIEFVHAELEGKAYRGLPLDGGGTIAGDACR